MSAKSIRLIRFGYLSLLAMWFICELTGIIFLGLSKNLSLYHDGNHVYFTDFIHFYLAGKMTLSASRDLFYSWDVQKAFLVNIIPATLPGRDFYTPFIPIVFLMMAPYALLPIDYAHLLFNAVNLCFGLAGCCMVIRYFKWTGNKMAWWILLGALASYPCGQILLLGQISWLYVGLIGFFLVFMYRKQDLLAGLALFFTIIKPQYAIFLVILPFYLKRFRLILYSAGWGLLFLILCGAIFSWKSMLAYLAEVHKFELLYIHTKAMYCVRPFFELFLSQQQAYYCCLFFLIAAFCSIIFIVLFRTAKDEKSFQAWLVSVLILACLLFSPHTFSHDVILLVIPALLTLPNASLEPDLIIWRSIFYFLPIAGWLCFALVCLQLPGNLILVGFMVVLFACGLRQLLKLKMNPSENLS